MEQKQFEALIEATAKTWRAYAVAIGVLYLSMVVDVLSKAPFFLGYHPIELGGFKIVREALSATYGIVFSGFVATVCLESNLLRKRLCSIEVATLSRTPVLDLWFLSPFSDSRLLRAMFWLLFADGFVLLAIFSIIHIALILPPDPARMSELTYRSIGAFDLLLLIVCVPFGYKTFGNLSCVQDFLLKSSAASASFGTNAST